VDTLLILLIETDRDVADDGDGSSVWNRGNTAEFSVLI
jgi:hypothetical protein